MWHCSVEVYCLVDGPPAHVAHLDGLDALGAGCVAAGKHHVLLPLHADRAQELLLPLGEPRRQLGVGGWYFRFGRGGVVVRWRLLDLKLRKIKI